MILYVNGSSHAAAAEAVNSFCFCHDDKNVAYLKNLPHPDNLAVSWGKQLSIALKAGLQCSAHDNTNNLSIVNETRCWAEENSVGDKFVAIQWCDFINHEEEHNEIWILHQDLLNKNIKHIFFNTTEAFNIENPYVWGANYIGPYDSSQSYTNIIRSKNIDLAPNARHFGKDGHSAFNQFMLQYIIKNQLL